MEDHFKIILLYVERTHQADASWIFLDMSEVLFGVLLQLLVGWVRPLVWWVCL